MTRSRLCPHCAVLLDFCPFSELFSSLLFRELLFCSGLVNWCLLLESRNADHYNTARAHSKMLIKADSPYLAPMAVISLIEYSYSWHSRTSYLLLQLFRFPRCVILLGTNLKCLWKNTHHITSYYFLDFFFLQGTYIICSPQK